MPENKGLRIRIAEWIAGTQSESQKLKKVTSTVDDSPGWDSHGMGAHDRSLAESQEIYRDALDAWRKNPIAWRTIGITTDYVIGDDVSVDSTDEGMKDFIDRFWNHPKNRMSQRMEMMSDELSRAGDLFVVLFLDKETGMSFIRFVTKDEIVKIKVATNDWETELSYSQRQRTTTKEKIWISPENKASKKSTSIMLHYSVNRPIGGLVGESDLGPIIPWLQRYSKMLEDRVRMHWAIRAFLWVVTVPTSKVKAKKEQYRRPPKAGSIIVKDDGEKWEPMAPNLRAGDAQFDLKAVRGYIDAGSGYPPHWRGEPGDANLATAQAMQGPTERHLGRRQRYFKYMIEDIIFNAYQRAVEIDKEKQIEENDYKKLFTSIFPEISRFDNSELSRASENITKAAKLMAEEFPSKSRKYTKLALDMQMKFAGTPITEEMNEAIMVEAFRDDDDTE